jgi:hypothetical protein
MLIDNGIDHDGAALRLLGLALHHVDRRDPSRGSQSSELYDF